MKDKDFKRLEHKYKNYRKYSDGKEIAYGYRPDYVLYQEKEYIIFEFESGSSRKTFVGDMIKAAHFLAASVRRRQAPGRRSGPAG